MSTTARALGRRVAAAAGALAIGVAGLGLASGAAVAADGNIDTSRTGSIIIHKHESGSQGNNGTADGQTGTNGGDPVADVVFTAFPISNLDLTTQAAWDGLKTLSVPATACGADDNTPSLTLPGGAAATFDAGVVSAPTDATGLTTIGNLPVKAYLVCETSAPATVKTKAAPFLVTIPFPNNTANTAHPDGNWLYDVNVYPKNTVVLAPTKSITVEETKHGVQTGEQVTFPVTAKIPSIAATDNFTHFIIDDPLDANMENGKVVSVKIDGVDVPASYYTATEGQTVTVGFNSAGLAHLKTKPNSTIEVVFAATVKSIPADGNIRNTAKLYVDAKPSDNPPDTPPTTPNDIPPGTPDGGTPTNEVVSSWGDVKVLKQDKDNAKALEGAVFQVYNATDPYAADCSAATKTGDPIAVGGVNEFTSDATGVVSIAGLFVDSKAGAAGVTGVTPDHTQRCYVLVETKAPAGYVLTTDNSTPVAVKAGLTADKDVTIDNTKQDVPQLPLTGAAGRVLLMMLGAALILGAVGFALSSRKRRAQA